MLPPGELLTLRVEPIKMRKELSKFQNVPGCYPFTIMAISSTHGTR